jgi:hypothetical protein
MQLSRLDWRHATDRFPIAWTGGFDPEETSTPRLHCRKAIAERKRRQRWSTPLV